ncbi:MAG TPA: hypothetical protein VM534_00500, partial [Thermoanaerobaculia bacterium]|nr:hypothetical protein [Thermoanaerobaculia bacterium]
MPQALRFPLFFLLLQIAAIPLFADPWTIPGVANTGGENGARFVSDLVITNPDTTTRPVTLRFVPPAHAAGLPDQVVEVGAGATLVLRNLLQTVWGVSNLGGAITANSDGELVIRASTYNAASAGTYGVALQVLRDQDLLSAGETGIAGWVSHSVDLRRDFRTNFAVVFPDAAGGAARVTLRGPDGSILGIRDYDVAHAAFLQQSVGTLVSDSVAVGRVDISVQRGRAHGYTSVADNITGDASLFPAMRPPAGATDVVLGGMARTEGLHDTYFRSDVRMFNPGASPVEIQAHLLPAGNTAPATITLLPGETRELIDVLDVLFAAPQGATGAIRFVAPQPVVIMGRTSNLDPAEPATGTFGAQQYAVPYDAFSDSSETIQFGAVSLNGTVRTNLGISSGPTGAEWTSRLLDASGALLEESSSTLPPYSWTQASIGSWFQGGIPDDSRIEIAPRSGSLSAYVSLVDQISGDATVAAGGIWEPWGPLGPASRGRGGPWPGTFTLPGELGRNYIVHVPQSYGPEVPARLLFALGGQGQSASSVLKSGWREIAEAENLIVVTLTASSSGPGYAGAYEGPELATIQRAEQDVPKLYNVALRHISFWGFSAGAHVTYMFGLEAARSQR